MPALRRLVESDKHDVIAVPTRPDAAAGRRGKPAPSPVAQLAADHGIPVLKPDRPNSAEFVAELAALAPDACAVVAYGALLRDELLAVPAHGWVNLHFSLLPAWRGAAPVQAAIAAGDAVTGATTFLIERDLDSGPIFGVVTETVRPTDTAGDLLAQLADSGAGLLEATMDGIADGSLNPVRQPTDGITVAPKITVEEARVRWDLPAHAVDRRIRDPAVDGHRADGLSHASRPVRRAGHPHPGRRCADLCRPNTDLSGTRRELHADREPSGGARSAAW